MTAYLHPLAGTCVNAETIPIIEDSPFFSPFENEMFGFVQGTDNDHDWLFAQEVLGSVHDSGITWLKQLNDIRYTICQNVSLMHILVWCIVH